MSRGRLEAFSDGVIAILITIMVLELRTPTGTDLEALRPLAPVLLSYVLSFVNLGIYWNNHHHLLQAATRVDGRVLWANLLLLFWLSLFPFGTAWMGENQFAPIPTAIYGVILLLAGAAYYLLERVLISVDGQSPALAAAVGSDRKGIVSLVVYVFAVPIALAFPWLALALYFLVALMWIVPDQRIERALGR
jgi:TMEM175 potassium channel family protein